MDEEQKLKLQKSRVLELQKSQVFWAEEYPQLSLDDRKKYWFKKLYRRVYWDGTNETADISVFNENTYKEWKKLDAEMDVILDYLVETLDREFGANGIMKDRIEKTLGRNK